MSNSAYDRLRKVFSNLQGSMSNPEAFYAILACAVAADGVIDRKEAEELDALVLRTKTLAALQEKNPSELSAIRTRVDAKLGQKDQLTALAADAARTIATDSENKKSNGDMAWSVFAHAADIVFADSKVVQQEMDYLMQLAENLALPVEHAENILEFLRKKNAY